MSANYTEWVGTTPAPSTIHRRFGRYKKKNECCDDSSRDCKSQWSDELNGIFVLNAGDAPVNVVLSATCILASVLYHVCLSPVGFFVTKKNLLTKRNHFCDDFSLRTDFLLGLFCFSIFPFFILSFFSQGPDHFGVAKAWHALKINDRRLEDQEWCMMVKLYT